MVRVGSSRWFVVGFIWTLGSLWRSVPVHRDTRYSLRWGIFVYVFTKGPFDGRPSLYRYQRLLMVGVLVHLGTVYLLCLSYVLVYVTFRCSLWWDVLVHAGHRRVSGQETYVEVLCFMNKT